MKRYGQLFEKFITYENLDLAERKARRGKGSRGEVRAFLKNREENLRNLQKRLMEGTWHTSERFWKKVKDPKERIIGVLPYYPDLIVHYALLNILEPIFMKMVISDTYSCIKGRGIHACSEKVVYHLHKYQEETVYALQIDISKCYNNINHEIMKGTLRHKIKDERILAVAFDIIDSNDGLVIGDHIASWLCNVFLNPIDHKMKEVMRMRHYFRYADDIVIMAATKEELWAALEFIERELLAIGLRVKHNAKIFPIDKQGLDFIGYVFYHDHVMLRKRIKVNLKKKVDSIVKRGLSFEEARQELAGHWGWLKHCNSINLQKVINKKLNYNEEVFRHDAA